MKKSKYALVTVVVVVIAALVGGVLYYFEVTRTPSPYCQSGGGFNTCPVVGGSSVTCWHGIGGNATGSGYCVISVTNSGGSAAAVTGCTLFGAAGVSGAGSGPPPVVAGEVIVPGGEGHVNVVCSGAAVAIAQGAVVNGTLIFDNVPPLVFSAIAIAS